MCPLYIKKKQTFLTKGCTMNLFFLIYIPCVCVCVVDQVGCLFTQLHQSAQTADMELAKMKTSILSLSP